MFSHMCKQPTVILGEIRRIGQQANNKQPQHYTSFCISWWLWSVILIRNKMMPCTNQMKPVPVVSSEELVTPYRTRWAVVWVTDHSIKWYGMVKHKSTVTNEHNMNGIEHCLTFQLKNMISKCHLSLPGHS